MTEKLGIKETLDVIVLGASIAQDTVESYEDGKFTGTDIVNYSDTLMAIMPAIEGIDKVPAEMADIDSEEALVIRDTLLQKIPGIGAKWKEFAVHCFNAGYNIWMAVKVLQRKDA